MIAERGGEPVRVERFDGAAVTPYLPALAALRLEVFREFPYLYEGTADYEARYLASYAGSPASTVVIAFAGEMIVGASTALPLTQHGDDVVPALAGAGYDPARVYYFGESVLRAPWRGQGVGRAFFVHREAAARAHGFAVAAFCAVDRAATDPRRPAGYLPHDAFWTRRGFVRRPDIQATFEWRDLGDADETPHRMIFWLKELTP